MFEEVDALPGSEGKSAVDERDGELHLGERCFEMGRHIVRSFGVMLVGTGLGREVIEVGDEVRAHSGVGVLLNEEGRGGVAAEDGEQAGVHRLLLNPLVDGGRAFVEALAPRCDFDTVS